jgi:hypothetical protein
MRRAGLRLTTRPAPPPAPADSLAPCTSRASQLLAELFATGNVPLLSEATALLAAARQRLRPELLPAALAVADPALRRSLMPVLGQRGAWLARLRPDWSWAAGAAPPQLSPEEAKTLWEEGSFPERLDLLRRLRATAPETARALLESSWKAEKAEQRAQIVEALGGHLGVADEPFLESVLDDRSASVREEAAPLLARLPGSALSRRMEERARGLIARAERSAGLLGKLKALGKGGVTLAVAAPSELDASWERDGVPRKPPQGVSAKSFWLERTLSLVRPSLWEEQLGTAPHEIADALRAHEDAPEVLEGLTRAALLFRDGRWLAALWDAWYALPVSQDERLARVAGDRLRELLPALAPRDATARVERLLTAPHGAFAAGDALGALPVPWTVALSQSVARALQPAFSDAEQLHRVMGPLQLAARGVASAALDTLEAAIAAPPVDAPAYVQRALAEARETIRLRRILHQEIRP